MKRNKQKIKRLILQIMVSGFAFMFIVATILCIATLDYKLGIKFVIPALILSFWALRIWRNE